MNKIISKENCLDFKDVLILPKLSSINSRNDVNLEREFIFNNGVKWKGIPIIAANMTTVGTFEVYKELSKYKILTALHKFYKLNDFHSYNKNNPTEQLNPDYFMISTGISDSDYYNLKYLLNNIDCKWILIDIANGYIDNLKNFIYKIKNEYPNKIIVAGNVCTDEGVRELIKYGADVIKTGIGGGCFKGDTRILMANGKYKNISKITPGDYVINKYGQPVRVHKLINRGIKNLITIKTNSWYNETEVSKDHKYWTNDYNTCKWKSLDTVDYITENTSMPFIINWRLPKNFKFYINNVYKNSKNSRFISRDISSNYNLGYIFSSFISCGFIDYEFHYVYWKFKFNNNNYSSIKNIIKKLHEKILFIFGVNCEIVKNEKNKLFTLKCNDNILTNVFYDFYDLNKPNDNILPDKCLPDKYYCLDKPYIEGIFNALFDINKQLMYLNNKCKNKVIVELFYWCCITLKLPYNSICDDDDIYSSYNHNLDNILCGKIERMNLIPKPEIVWDIEVDCKTHSFIANNAVVHNSACTTRIQTGIGMPQFTCILDSCKYKNNLNQNNVLVNQNNVLVNLNNDLVNLNNDVVNLNNDLVNVNNIYILSDGGITCPGDLGKAYGGGSDFIMIGGIFAGHDENPGEIIEENGEKYKFFYGMSSSYAMKNNYAANNNTDYRSSEGREIKIKYKGPIENTIKNYLGGLRSTCTYTNSKNIKDLQDNCQFILVNNQYNEKFVK